MPSDIAAARERLAAVERAEIQELLNTHYARWESGHKEGASNYLMRLLYLYDRLLSLLTPPTDAEVREAVGWVQEQLDNGWWEELAAEKARIILSYVRAVQAPRPNKKQVEAVRKAQASAVFPMPPDGDGQTVEISLDSWRALAAAFPEALAGEV